jgi:catechol 2,3-dioxygenase-like lactoylglutathione lyase family enzyme
VKVQRLAWLGTRTDKFEDTRRFFTDVLGLRVEHEEPGFAMLDLPAADRDYVEVFGPDIDDGGFSAAHYRTGPVVGLQVDDIVAARAELAEAGIELLDEITWLRSTPGYGWFHFRGPDGNVYSLLQGSKLRPES